MLTLDHRKSKGVSPLVSDRMKRGNSIGERQEMNEECIEEETTWDNVVPERQRGLYDGRPNGLNLVGNLESSLDSGNKKMTSLSN